MGWQLGVGETLGTIVDRRNAFLVRAMSATVKASARLDAVAYDFAPAMLAFGRQSIYGALEAVKVVGDSIYNDFDGLVVFISANFTSVHKKLLLSGKTLPQQN